MPERTLHAYDRKSTDRLGVPNWVTLCKGMLENPPAWTADFCKIVNAEWTLDDLEQLAEDLWLVAAETGVWTHFASHLAVINEYRWAIVRASAACSDDLRSGAVKTEGLNGDLLMGAQAIADFMGFDRRQVYHMAANEQIPVFRLWRDGICARKSTILAWIEKQEKGKDNA